MLVFGRLRLYLTWFSFIWEYSNRWFGWCPFRLQGKQWKTFRQPIEILCIILMLLVDVLDMFNELSVFCGFVVVLYNCMLYSKCATNQTL